MSEPRPQKLLETVTVRLSDDAYDKLCKVARRTGLRRAEVARGLIERYLQACA